MLHSAPTSCLQGDQEKAEAGIGRSTDLDAFVKALRQCESCLVGLHGHDVAINAFIEPRTRQWELRGQKANIILLGTESLSKGQLKDDRQFL